MLLAPLLQLEANLFRTFNRLAEPLIRAGWGNPLLWPTGTIVVETTGHQSGRKHNLPVLATRSGNLVWFGTVRARSHWVKNLSAQPQVRYWLGGQPHEATAIVLTPHQTISGPYPAPIACLAQVLQQQSRLFGMSFAILAPREKGESDE